MHSDNKKIAVIGSRTVTNYKQFKILLSKYLIEQHIDVGSVTFVSGGARGADSLAQRFANEFERPIIVHEALWDLYGKAAGYIRNVDIVKDADIVIAFWDGVSKGTKHSIDLAKKQNKIVEIIKWEDEYDFTI